MFWQIPVFTRIVVANIFLPIVFKGLLKKIGGEKQVIKQYLLWQYIGCFSISVIYALASNFHFTYSFLIVMAMGFFLNSFGVYCYWRAVEINLSKTALLTQLDDVIAFSLGYLILGESRYLNTWLTAGLGLCFIAASLLVTQISNRRLMKFIVGYSIPWGIVAFLYRLLALNGIAFSTFMVGWYSGSLLGTTILISLRQNIFITAAKAIKESSRCANANLLAIIIWASAFLYYWGAKLSPVTVYQPISMVAEAIFPALIGLFIFKESKILSMRDKLAFVAGAAGITFIGFSY